MIVICFHYSFFQIKNPTFHARDMVTITLIRFMLVLQILKKYTDNFVKTRATTVTACRQFCRLTRWKLPCVDQLTDSYSEK